jgi:TolA-binding protein
MFNWRPVYDIEQRELESRKRTNQLRIESLEGERRTQQLESAFEQRELERDKRLKQLEIENRRLAALESRMDALLLNADSSSQTPPSTGSN